MTFRGINSNGVSIMNLATDATHKIESTEIAGINPNELKLINLILKMIADFLSRILHEFSYSTIKNISQRIIPSMSQVPKKMILFVVYKYYDFIRMRYLSSFSLFIHFRRSGRRKMKIRHQIII